MFWFKVHQLQFEVSRASSPQGSYHLVTKGQRVATTSRQYMPSVSPPQSVCPYTKQKTQSTCIVREASCHSGSHAFVNTLEPPCHQHSRPPPHHHFAIDHCQAFGSGQPETLPGGSTVAPHFASGSCARLKHVMDELAQFQRNHIPPTNEDELMVYCQVLGPVLATLETAGTEKCGCGAESQPICQHTQTEQSLINTISSLAKQPFLLARPVHPPEDSDGLQHQTEVCLANSHQGACAVQRF